MSGRQLLVLLAGAMVAQACGSNPPASVIVTGVDGLRTFTTFTEYQGYPVACPAYAVADAVQGTFAGGAGRREPAWLVDKDGGELSIVWPEGFTVRFEPMAALYNESGTVVAREGQSVELGQTASDSASGEYDDPYIAQGIVFGGCYPYRARDISRR